jgi:hypothetical protein
MSGGYFGIGDNPGTDRLYVSGTSKFTDTVTIETTGTGRLNFYNNSSTRYWRVGSNINTSQFFTFEAGDSNGSTNFTGAPALAITGTGGAGNSDNAVTINTTATSGTDPTDGTTVRHYQLNVQGDFNINGQLFQDNAEFVTSRWTEATNGDDIYRLSKVGINKADPTYTLHVAGGVNIEGTSYTNGLVDASLFVNGNRQWVDENAIIKLSLSTLNQSLSVPAGYNANTFGPLDINTNVVVTVVDGATWSVI